MATRESFPVHCFQPLFERAALPTTSLYDFQFVQSRSMDLGTGTVTKGDLGSNNKVHGVTGMTTNDGMEFQTRIPRTYDRGSDIYVRCLFMPVTANKNPTWAVKYLAYEIGDDYNAAIESFTALDDPISGNTDGESGDEGKLRTTDWGRLAYSNFADLDEIMTWYVYVAANGGVTNWTLVGVEIAWPQAVDQ